MEEQSLSHRLILYRDVVTLAIVKCLQNGGIRAKLLAADGNHIDTLFLDRRIESLGKYHFGSKLVCKCV